LAENYLNKELNKSQEALFLNHLSSCKDCQVQLSALEETNKTLDCFDTIKIHSGLLYSLKQIPFDTKRRFSIFQLLPKELATVAISVFFAFAIGALISTASLQASIDYFYRGKDLFEQISLTVLLEDE
jgi:hypothetical protein